MQGGDLSNESPPSVLVNIEAILDRTNDKKRLLGFLPQTREQWSINLGRANALYRVASTSPLTWEGLAIGMSEGEVGQLTEELDRLGLNGFRWITPFESIQSVLEELPYRRRPLGVLDRSENALRWGSHFVSMDMINGR